MGWRYGHKQFKNGDAIECGLVEVYPGIGTTENAVSVYADSPEELAKWLRQAADDVEKYAEEDKKGYDHEKS